MIGQLDNNTFISRTLVALFIWVAGVSCLQAEEDFLASLSTKIGDLEYVNRTDYPEKSMGYSLRYQDSEMLKVDIYVYDNGMRGLKEGINSPEVRDEMQAVANGLEQMQKLGKYQNVADINTGEHHFVDLKTRFLWARHSYNQTLSDQVQYNGKRISDTFLTVHKGKYIKLRVTARDTDIKKDQPTIDLFVKEVARLIDKDS